MECNKDEAVRARQMAEARMQRGDFVEALRFATKAKKLYADVENITQILTICEVHNAAHKKLSATDMDWYAILQIERLADEAVIKKQYRRLALLLHPDKNKYAGAEAAFKLIGQANGVLSDQAKRSSYDSQFGISKRGAAPKSTAKRNAEKCQKRSESHQNSDGNVFTAKHDDNATNYQKKSHPNSANSNNQAGPMTFWTSCQHCNFKFQYCVQYANANLLCVKCLKSFKAHVISFGVPPSMFTSVNIQKEAPIPGPPKPDSESTGQKPVRSTARFVRSQSTFMKKCAAGVGAHCEGEKSKDGSVPVSESLESQSPKNVGSKRVRQSAPDSGERFKARNCGEMLDANVRENDRDHSRVGARRSSRKKQHVSYMETSDDDELEIPSKTPRQNDPLNADDVKNKTVPASNGSSNRDNPATSAAGVADPDQNREKISESKEYNFSPLNSNIPSASKILPCFDADFNDFEKDKEESCFAVKQIWAVYDSVDGMPRFYAIVKKVTSPFKLQITWLEADPDNEDELDWQKAHLPIACGKFRRGSSQKATSCTMFSHQVRCIKETGKGSYLVYPNKGETWAIFRDWDIKWSSNPKEHLEYVFEYVEILSDFSKDMGIAVAYLDKAKGFVSLFQRTLKNGVDMFYVRPNELYRFSHQIPSFKMSGNERKGVPRGSFECDPAALPFSLFEVSD